MQTSFPWYEVLPRLHIGFQGYQKSPKDKILCMELPQTALTLLSPAPWYILPITSSDAQSVLIEIRQPCWK